MSEITFPHPLELMCQIVGFSILATIDWRIAIAIFIIQIRIS